MYIKSIQLQNYRNYEEADLNFSPGVNILYGDNAQGKTNLLESVYLCGTSRSHRSVKDKELIRFGKEEAHIRLSFVKGPLTHQLDFHLKNKKAKGIAMDGIPIRKISELMGFFHVVFFSPEDLGLIKNGPALRRKFVDMELGQLDRAYLQQLLVYNKALNQRNILLKQIYQNPSLKETLDVWDAQLIESGRILIRKRSEFVKEIDQMMREIHGNLSGGKEVMEVLYEKNVSEEDFALKLADSRDRDLRTGMTNVGPHRDDLCFNVNQIDLRKFGSQGQQRTAALSLKLSEIRLIEERTGEKPILLLDDVLSELDSNRQQFLLGSIQDVQTLISCTGLDDFVNSRLKLDKVFLVENGHVAQYDDFI